MRREPRDYGQDERTFYRWWGEMYKPVYLLLIAKSWSY
jgi:hypothetical protein